MTEREDAEAVPPRRAPRGRRAVRVLGVVLAAAAGGALGAVLSFYAGIATVPYALLCAALGAWLWWDGPPHAR